MFDAAPTGSARRRDRDRSQGPMIDQRPDRLPVQPPTVSPPRAFTDRRVTFRRAEDRIAHAEKALLARALDVLASDSTAEERLAHLLRLLARTVGAERAAVVADGIERRAAVAIDPDEDPAVAEALAAWLDVHAPRSRARRAASARAPISFIIAAVPGAADGSDMALDIEDDESDGQFDPEARLRRDARLDPDARASWGLAVLADASGVGEGVVGTAGAAAAGDEATAATAHYAVLPIPSAGDVALGFEFRRPADVERLAERLPPTMARHAAVALALVTSQLATERELAALRARDAERLTFVSTVAHELRTPLTGLHGYLELILAGKVGDPVVEREFLERSRSIVGSMDELVGDLLELSRLESGTLGLEIGPFSLAEAGGQVAASLLPIAIEREIHLTTALPPRMRMATADRRRVEQILTNLAANALKYTPLGGRVEIEARFDGLVAVITVRDDGTGMSTDDRSRIFERFHRLPGHERITGTGLGLPIARDLARRMDGDLDVASVLGAGSAFVLVLPGPAIVDRAFVNAVLATALEREEAWLEEELVRDAIAAGRAVAAATPDDAGKGDEEGPEGSTGAGDVERPDGVARRVGGLLRVLPTRRPDTPTPV